MCLVSSVEIRIFSGGCLCAHSFVFQIQSYFGRTNYARTAEFNCAPVNLVLVDLVNA